MTKNGYDCKLQPPIGPLIIALALLCFWSLPASAKSKWVASGDLRGEIKPCGCSADGDLGGLQRRATLLSEWRELDKNLIYLDLGNNFPPPSEQGALKVKLMQDALQLLKPQAILLGPNELNYGVSSIDLKLPYLVSNLKEAKALTHFKAYIDVEAEGKKVRVLGYLSPTLVYQNSHDAPSFISLDKALLSQWAQESQKAKLPLVLLFRGNEAELTQAAESNLFNLIIVGNNNDDELHQVLEMKTSLGVFAAVPTKGQGLTVYEVEQMKVAEAKAIAAGGNTKKVENKERIESAAKVEWLAKKYADSPMLASLYQNYDEQVKTLFFANLERKELQEKETPYAGEKVCQSCHVQEHATWSQVRHAKAYATLQNVKKNFDPDCVVCHTVGFNKQGFLSPELTPNFMNVQCENCHGPAKGHSADPKKVLTTQKPAAQACSGCHKGSHSPKFDFATYWPKIEHKNTASAKGN